ncbi:hypothetical protein, partial [Pseudotamlana haliotis]|uniref:hypothetical protein n=1 Tax=Pseudotamlana haliotis TaxID=2614804 RepID=UPI0017826D21
PAKKIKVEEKPQLASETNIIQPEKPSLTIQKAINFALNLKQQTLNPTSYRGLNNRMNNFNQWISKQHPELKSINQLNKKNN